MQSTSAGEDVAVAFYVKDPDSTTRETCETFWMTDRASWVVQGKRGGVEVSRQLVGLAEDETFCEVSERTVNTFVVAFVKERYGLDLGQAALRAQTNSSGETRETFWATDRASWVVQGKRGGVEVSRQLVGLAEDETFCEVSERTVNTFVIAYVKERYGADLSEAAPGTA
ncbi:hypothetical protein [Spirillospora sp. CA-294931]|uniref:hypothetical protein n=1 Tax=Spirillospora sp. CA-294931 TaxID=3240042 RepID=UPI003D8DBE41